MSQCALVIAPGLDYHWYRQNPDGSWSHKPGWWTARIQDDSNNTIYDPEAADRVSNPYLPDYIWFIGYFAMEPMNNMYVEELLITERFTELPFETDKSKINPLKEVDLTLLKHGMTQTEVMTIIGKAHFPYGSSFANLCYKLDDGKTVVLCYRQGEDRVIYLNTAFLINRDGTQTKLL